MKWLKVVIELAKLALVAAVFAVLFLSWETDAPDRGKAARPTASVR